MSHSEDKPFAADEMLLIRAEQQNVAAPDAAMDRVRARLLAAPPSSGDRTEGQQPHASAPGGILSRVNPKLIGALATAAALGAGAHATLTSPRERIVYVDRVVAPAASASPPAIGSAAPLSLPEPASTSPAPDRPASSADRKGEAASSSLAEERLLLDAARNAIVRGEPEEALAPLDAHRARFPEGSLAEEREALAIKALARIGRQSEAESRAALFRRRFPQSLLEDGVDHDLQKNP